MAQVMKAGRLLDARLLQRGFQSAVVEVPRVERRAHFLGRILRHARGEGVLQTGRIVLQGPL